MAFDRDGTRFFWEKPWIKVLIIGKKRALDSFEPIYRRDYDSGCSVRSGDCFLDIVSIY